MYSICLKVELPKRVQYVEVQNTEEKKTTQSNLYLYTK